MNISLWLAVLAKVIKLLLSPEFKEVLKQCKELRDAIGRARSDGKLTTEEIKELIKEASDIGEAIENLVKAV